MCVWHFLCPLDSAALSSFFSALSLSFQLCFFIFAFSPVLTPHAELKQLAGARPIDGRHIDSQLFSNFNFYAFVVITSVQYFEFKRWISTFRWCIAFNCHFAFFFKFIAASYSLLCRLHTSPPPSSSAPLSARCFSSTAKLCPRTHARTHARIRSLLVTGEQQCRRARQEVAAAFHQLATNAAHTSFLQEPCVCSSVFFSSFARSLDKFKFQTGELHLLSVADSAPLFTHITLQGSTAAAVKSYFWREKSSQHPSVNFASKFAFCRLG